jgi:hypothetical protein
MGRKYSIKREPSVISFFKTVVLIVVRLSVHTINYSLRPLMYDAKTNNNVSLVRYRKSYVQRKFRQWHDPVKEYGKNMEFESVCLYGWAWAIGMVIPGQRVAILDPRLPAMAERIRSVPFPKGSDPSFSLPATAKSMWGAFLALLRHSNEHLIA